MATRETEAVERFEMETESGFETIGVMDPDPQGEWVRYQDYERVWEERKQLLSAIKQHRNATESRLRMLNGREAIDTMLKPDQALYNLAYQMIREQSGSGEER